MRNRHVFLLGAALAAIGLGVSAYKYLVIGIPLSARTSGSAWEIESEVRVAANGGPLKLSLFAPEDSPEFSVLDQRLAAPDFGTTTAPEGPNRRLNLSVRNARGVMVARLRFLVHRNKTRVPDRRPLPPFAQPVTLTPTAQKVARTLYAAAHAKSADEVGLVSMLLQALISPDRTADVRYLLGDDRTAQKIASVAAQILRVNGHFARSVHGIDLDKTGVSVATRTWLEVAIGGHWRAFSLATGEPRIPRGYFAWWYDDVPFARADGGKIERQRLGVTRVEQTVLNQALALGHHHGSFLMTYSLYSLPATQRAVFRVIMSIPIGVFVLVLLRNVIGLRGVGTFMPVLIALSFRETHLLWGLVLFSVALAAGLVVRLYFEHLKLLLVARLGAIVMFVILFLAAVAVVSDKLSFEPGLSIVLFPLVILTMTIERISVIWDEAGPAEAVRLAAFSLVIAAFCYLLMTARPVQHLFFAFPEMILVLMAATILVGRYTGYRLSELVRFRVLAEQSK